MLSFHFFAGCVIRGVSNEVLHDHVLTMVGAKEQIQTIVNALKKCPGLIKHFQHGNDNVEFPLQPSSSSDDPLTNNHEINCIMHLKHLPTHVLLFDQVDSGKSRICAFLCRRIDERNLCLMLDLYYASFDEKLSARDRYEWSVLYTSSCLLRNCFRGSTFLFSLSLWLARKLVAIKCIVEGVLASPDDYTWVLSKEENHWTMTSVHDAVFTNNIHYDTLLMCISVDRLNLSQRFCIGRKRPQSTFHIIVDNSRYSCVKECFTCVDCIKSSDCCDPICVVSWCHDDFSKCLPDIDTIECNNNEYIGKIKLLSLYDDMERMPTADVKFINQPQPIIMNKACSCCKSDVNGAIHICSRVDTSNKTYDIIASLSFEKEFNLATCNKEYVSTNNLSMLDTESKLFLYKVDKKKNVMKTLVGEEKTLEP